MTTYQVDPALEYRTLAHASNSTLDYGRPSIRFDGRILAVGTDQAPLWDLAGGTELALLPIGNAWHLMFEPSGDLLTRGDAGVLRWPIRLVPERGEFRIGPPLVLHLPAATMAIAQDRAGRILAVANGGAAQVQAPSGRSRSGRSTIAVASPSARMGDGWRPAVISGAPGSITSATPRTWPICRSRRMRRSCSAPTASG